MPEIEAIVILLAAVAALVRIEELVVEDWVRENTAERVRELHNHRRSRFSARLDDDEAGLEDRFAPTNTS